MPDPLAPERRIALAAALLLAALALAMYRPWEPRPFDILDFSEFLPFLRESEGVWGRIVALVGYYGSEHGRLNLVSYVALALKWTVLGDDPVLWQWARFLQMALLVGGVYLVLRRLAVRPLGALAGASLFIVSRVAGEGWTRMTMGEPLGLLGVLGALWIAVGWRRSRRPLRDALLAGSLLVFAVLAKEMLAGMVPFVWLVGTGVDGEGRLGPPRLDAAGKRWLFWTGVLPIAAFLAALVTALGGSAQSFTGIYGETGGGVVEFFRLVGRPWFVQGMRPGPEALLLPGNTLFALLLLGGLLPALRSPEGRSALRWPAIGALGISLALAVLYIPWPYFNLYYAIPFLLGAAYLFGVAIDRLTAAGPLLRAATLLAWAGMAGSAAAATAHAAAYTIALQQVNGELLTELGRIPGAERVVVARRNLPPLAWIGTGPTLRRFALVSGAAATFPPTVDLLCDDVGALLRGDLGRTVVVNYVNQCGPLPVVSARVLRHYGYIWVTWGGVGTAPDSLVAELLLTPEAMRPR